MIHKIKIGFLFGLILVGAPVESKESPTFEEYRKIECDLRKVTERDLPPMQTPRCLFYCQKVKFIGDHPDQIPIFEILHFNKNPTDKKNCIVLYASYNSPYPENINKIISALKKVHFDGHVIYRIGGYPNIENGSLHLHDVPYAFKACALQEAYLLGYENLLWIDASMTPVKNLKPLFKTIEKMGYFAMTSGSTIRAQVDNGMINHQALAAMDVAYADSHLAPHITTPMFGINVRSEIGKKILDSFYRIAEERTSFFCDWVDEAPLSAILFHLKLKPLGSWHQFMVKDWEWDGTSTGHYFSMSQGRPS
jgi:hypothetical protein